MFTSGIVNIFAILGRNFSALSKIIFYSKSDMMEIKPRDNAYFSNIIPCFSIYSIWSYIYSGRGFSKYQMIKSSERKTVSQSMHMQTLISDYSQHCIFLGEVSSLFCFSEFVSSTAISIGFSLLIDQYRSNFLNGAGKSCSSLF